MNRAYIVTLMVWAVMASAAVDAAAAAQQADEARTLPPTQAAELPGDAGPEKPVRKSRLAERREGEPAVNYDLDVSYETSRPAQKDNCLQHTGSRVRRDSRAQGSHCSGSPGRVYLREDLDADGNMKGSRR